MEMTVWRRGRRGFAPVCAACLVLLGRPAAGQTAPQPEAHARVSLIAERAAVLPSKTLWVGLLFQLDPDWHIYWQNAGDSGEPPKIQWEVPPGLKVGTIRWPVPMRLGSGSVIDYGYEGQVLLMAPITPRAGASEGALGDAPASIGAAVKYVVCREICIPAKTRLVLTMPAKDEAPDQAAQWRKLFEHTRAQLPKPAPAGWKISAELSKGQLILAVEGANAPQKAVFFPAEPGVIQNSAKQALEPFGNGFRLALQKSENSVKPVSAVRGVLFLDEHRGFEVNAPVVLPSRGRE